MVKRGTMSIVINDNIVLTDLAYEKAKRLGMSLVSPKASTPPSAPVRPYLSNHQRDGAVALKPAPAPALTLSAANGPQKSVGTFTAAAAPSNAEGIAPLAVVASKSAAGKTGTHGEQPAAPAGYPTAYTAARPEPAELQRQIRDAVISRLGRVDPALLDVIVRRVLKNAGVV